MSPDYTMELLYATLYKLRRECNFRGYIHVKAIRASRELVEPSGFLADRMSINLELPATDGLKALAPHKTQKILEPIKSGARQRTAQGTSRRSVYREGEFVCRQDRVRR